VPSVNRVTLLGHLGHEPEIRYTPKGTPVVNARLATTRRWKDSDSGDQREHTEWHRVVVFGNGAKFLGEYAHKGAQVYVEGSLRTRDWTDRDGVKRFTTEVVALNVQLLGKKTEVAAPPATDGAPAQDEPEESEDIPF
jgi:single-strand DNA-binding protein